MTNAFFHTLTNGQAVPLAAIPLHTPAQLGEFLARRVAAGARISALFAVPGAATAPARLYLLLADDTNHTLQLAATVVSDDSYASFTPQVPQAHLFEREIAEQTGLRPLDHPWLKPVRYCRSWCDRDAWQRPADQPIPPAVGDFYSVVGEEVHEVAVGPVHAGVIEPGHFRFQCDGEKVFHLEIALGYQHRGVEEALRGGPTPRTIALMETLSGDATIAHTTAYSHILEALTATSAPPRAHALRAIALELERLACHIGDIGALAADVGYLPTASFCGRIRGDFLNMSALLCGNRFGRGLVRPGGVLYNADSARLRQLAHQLDAGERDATVAIELFFDARTVLLRFDEVGTLPLDVATDLGIVGPAARASGLKRDIRHDHPLGAWTQLTHHPELGHSGDVMARAQIRWLEIKQSIALIREALRTIPDTAHYSPGATSQLAPNSLAIALAEGWRGEVCHVAITDAKGRFERYKIVDPSFHNWPGLAYALRQQAISDFPICNKSFNLSYCGHDL